MARLIFDIETDGLAPTKVWCIVTKDVDTKAVTTYTEGQWSAFNEAIKEADEVIGHNIIGYDIPACERLLGTDFSEPKVTDTLVMSRLANPQRDGHSLAYWGEILGYPKGDYEDWSCFTPEMLAYCKQDVSVNEQVYTALISELDSFGVESLTLEHSVQQIIQKQVRNGWLLDQPKARDLVAELKEQAYTLEEEVQRVFKPLPTFIKEINPKIKKDGSTSIVGLKFLGDQWEQVSGPFSRIDWPVFNLGSRQQIGRYLKYFGWKPTVFTETGHPIVSEDVLKNVKGIPEADLIASYLLVQKRIAQVSSWLEAVDTDTQRVHGYVNTNGAVTGRMTHSKPNLAQVPSSSSLYGPECRACWIVDSGYKLVGIDASGLELRMLAHYMNDADYTNTILTGDIHTANQLAAGLDTRNQAKTFIYAYLYGAGDEKIGSIVGGGRKQGKKLKAEFLKATPALAELKDNVAVSAGKGYVTGLDGRKVFIRSEHAALNSLLQSAGSLIMKQALIILDKYAKIWKLDYKFVGNIHDEFQVEVREDQAAKFGSLAASCIEAAGIHFKLRCPLAGEFNLGDSWADTH
jgi:DNA polymerase I-like protein with 3'-5' exonuclease and polymerase domains